MLCGYTFDALLNARTHRFLRRREVDQFLSSFECLHHADDVALQKNTLERYKELRETARP